MHRQIVRPSSSRQRCLSMVVIAVVCAVTPGRAASAQDVARDDELGFMVGGWLGADFVERTFLTEDVFGPVLFGASLSQGNSILVSTSYTAYFSDWLASEVIVGFTSNKWTTVSGRVTDGILSGEENTISGITTVPVSVGLTARLPSAGRGPMPFVSIGAGAVIYEFKQSAAPLIITSAVGQPIDTLLFDLELGISLAPNAAVGVAYQLSSRIALRMEGRLWLTLIRDRLADEQVMQKNGWVTLGSAFVF